MIFTGALLYLLLTNNKQPILGFLIRIKMIIACSILDMPNLLI